MAYEPPVQRYLPKQIKKVEKMLEEYKSWQVTETKGTCELVNNAACRCHTPEGRRRLKNNKDKRCPCSVQSTSLPNKVKGKQHKFLRVHQAIAICNEWKIPLFVKGKLQSLFRLHCSHICGRGNCRTREHVKIEPESDNQARKLCHKLMIEDGKMTSNPNCQCNPKCVYNH